MFGKCNCSLVSFEIRNNLPGLYHCYCTLCQKQGGTASNAATIVYSENFQWLSGQAVIRKWQKKTGFSSHFCGECGSPVPNIFKDIYVWVPYGLLENINPELKANIWISSKPEWATPTDLERNYDTAPDDLREFVSFLNSTETT